MNKQSIMIVDDNIELCETIADIFLEKGYMVDMAYNGAQAEKKFAEKFFNVALLDINLPDTDGTKLLGRIKNLHAETEVIIITGYASLESSITALSEGAFAYVLKPLTMDEVIAVVDQAFEKQKLILIKNMQVIKERESKEHYRMLSITDGLTELHNHRYFMELLSREIALAKRYLHPLSLLMIDIDNFKVCNDTYGHLVGDKALRNIAKLLKASCRAVDLIARYGGEEFAILMPYADKEGSIVVAERLRGLVERLQKDPPLTISIGAASYPLDAGTEEQLIASADQALYKAKREKNMVCMY